MTEITRERAAFAEWLARQHLGFDSRLTQVVYLPTSSPGDEVRLIEVNTGLFPQKGSQITAIETTPAIRELPFRVLVADVTPEEWRQIQSNPGLLPHGWNLDQNLVIQRIQRSS